MKAARECLRCHVMKPSADYPGPRARRCSACHAEVWADAPTACVICDGPLPPLPPRRYVPRVICDADECRRAAQLYGARVGGGRIRRLREQMPTPATRHCPQCDRTLPMSEQFFYVEGGAKNAPSRRFDRWCKECRRRKAIEYRTKRLDVINERRREVRLERLETMTLAAREQFLERERERKRESMRRARERDPERARALARKYKQGVKKDPIRHAKALEAQRMSYRLRQERRQGIHVADQRTANVRGPVVVDKVPDLPAAPLAAAIEERVAAERVGLFGEDDREARERVCRIAGVDPRNLYAWRTGERVTVRFNVADRALNGLGLLWWECWDPEEYPEVAEMFEGGLQVAA